MNRRHWQPMWALLMVLAVALVGVLPPSASAQNSPNPINVTQALQTSATSVGNGLLLLTGQLANVTLQISGTFVGTVSFEASNNGTNFSALSCYELGSSSALTSVTTTDLVSCNVVGLGSIRARVSAYTSGSITVVAAGSSQPTTFLPPTGAGVPGSGTVTSITFNAPLTGGTVTASGTVGLSTVGIANGGTGATTANTALNALLPTQTANNGKVLQTDGTNTSWQTASGGGTPGGSTTQCQFNNAGAFGGITGCTTNGTAVTLTSPVFITPALGTPASGVLTNTTGLPISGISATGTPSSANFLRGDGSWNTPAGAGTVTTTGSPASGQIPVMSGGTSITSSSALTSSAGAVVATGSVTANGLISNGAASGALTLKNVGGAGFSFIETVGNPAADVNVTPPVAMPASNALPRVATTAGVESWAVLTSAGGGTGTSSTLTGVVRGGSPMTAAELSGDVTTSGSNTATIAAGAVTAAKSAAVMTNRTLVLTVGSTASGAAALSTADADYLLVSFKCAIVASDVMLNAADGTVKFDIVRVATGGTALPSSSILTGGFLGVASGAAVHNPNTTLFASTAIAANDRIGLKVQTANTATYATVALQCNATD